MNSFEVEDGKTEVSAGKKKMSDPGLYTGLSKSKYSKIFNEFIELKGNGYSPSPLPSITSEYAPSKKWRTV